jgi:hypothetical protein
LRIDLATKEGTSAQMNRSGSTREAPQLRWTGPAVLHTPANRRGSSQPTPRPSKQLKSKTDTPKGEAAPHKDRMTEVATAIEERSVSVCKKNARG